MWPGLCSGKGCGKCGGAIRGPGPADVQKYSSFRRRQQLPALQSPGRKNKSDPSIRFRPPRQPDNQVLRYHENIAEQGPGEYAPERPCGLERSRSNPQLFGLTLADRRKQLGSVQRGALELGCQVQTASPLKRRLHKNGRRILCRESAKACRGIRCFPQRLQPIWKTLVATARANLQNPRANRSIQSAACRDRGAAFWARSLPRTSKYTGRKQDWDSPWTFSNLQIAAHIGSSRRAPPFPGPLSSRRRFQKNPGRNQDASSPWTSASYPPVVCW